MLWKIDDNTFAELQKLKDFINFVASIPEATDDDKQNALKAISILENCNLPQNYSPFTVCLDIFDPEIRDEISEIGGYYWRSWAVIFGNDFIEIEAISTHSEKEMVHFGDSFYYHASVLLKENLPCERVYIEEPIELFIVDAKNYKNYITDKINDIEIEITIGNE